MQEAQHAGQTHVRDFTSARAAQGSRQRKVAGLGYARHWHRALAPAPTLSYKPQPAPHLVPHGTILGRAPS